MVQFVAHQQTSNNNVAKDECASDNHNNNNNNTDMLGTANELHTTPLPHSHIPTIPHPDPNPPKEEEEEEEDEEEEGKTTTGYRDFRVFLIDAHKSQVERAKVIGKETLLIWLRGYVKRHLDVKLFNPPPPVTVNVLIFAVPLLRLCTVTQKEF